MILCTRKYTCANVPTSQNLKYAKIFKMKLKIKNLSLCQPDHVDHDVCDGTQYQTKKKVVWHE